MAGGWGENFATYCRGEWGRGGGRRATFFSILFWRVDSLFLTYYFANFFFRESDITCIITVVGAQLQHKGMFLKHGVGVGGQKFSNSVMGWGSSFFSRVFARGRSLVFFAYWFCWTTPPPSLTSPRPKIMNAPLSLKTLWLGYRRMRQEARLYGIDHTERWGQLLYICASMGIPVGVRGSRSYKGVYFANNSVIITPATMKLKQKIIRLAAWPKGAFIIYGRKRGEGGEGELELGQKFRNLLSSRGVGGWGQLFFSILFWRSVFFFYVLFCKLFLWKWYYMHYDCCRSTTAA